MSTYSSFSSIFGGAQAGLYDLPDEVAQHLRAIDELEAIDVGHAMPIESQIAPLRTEMTQALIASALEGKPKMPDVTVFEKLRREAAAAKDAWEVIEEARRQLPRLLGSAVRKHANAILVACLRPAFRQVLESAATAAEALEGYGLVPDPTALIAAPEEARRAWGELPLLSGHYAMLRAAYEALPLPGSNEVPHGMFAEFANEDVLWPDRGRHFARAMVIQNERDEVPSDYAPWPNQYPARLLYIVREAEAWLPTVEERNARYAAYIDKSKANRLPDAPHIWKPLHFRKTPRPQGAVIVPSEFVGR